MGGFSSVLVKNQVRRLDGSSRTEDRKEAAREAESGGFIGTRQCTDQGGSALRRDAFPQQVRRLPET